MATTVDEHWFDLDRPGDSRSTVRRGGRLVSDTLTRRKGGTVTVHEVVADPQSDDPADRVLRGEEADRVASEGVIRTRAFEPLASRSGAGIEDRGVRTVGGRRVHVLVDDSCGCGKNGGSVVYGFDPETAELLWEEPLYPDRTDPFGVPHTDYLAYEVLPRTPDTVARFRVR